MTSDQRRKLYVKLVREQLSRMTPNVPGNRYSGQQIAYAKGYASRRFKEMGL